MIDPLSLATRGKFTSIEYENNYPITVATLGYILSETSSQKSGGSDRYGKRTASFINKKIQEDPFLRKERERLRKEFYERVSVEVEESEELILSNPVSLQAPSLQDIKDEAEREIARLLRHKNILEFSEKLRQQEKDDDLFMEELAMMMVLLDD